jgi:hypothetical protein
MPLQYSHVFNERSSLTNIYKYNLKYTVQYKVLQMNGRKMFDFDSYNFHYCLNFCHDDEEIYIKYKLSLYTRRNLTNATI